MPLHNDLDRWREAGLIDEETAQSIAAFERDEGEPPRWLEALAYIGAALLLGGSIAIVTRVWDDMGPGTVVALTMVATLVSLLAGWAFGRAGNGVGDRAQATTWFLATIGYSLSISIFVYEVLDLAEAPAYALVALSTFAVAAMLWFVRRSSLQMVAMAVAAAAAAIVPFPFFDEAPEWLFGATLATLGVVWIVATRRGFFRPRRTSYAMGAIGVLLISFPNGTAIGALVLGTLVCIGLIALGSLWDEYALLGLGVAGLLWYPPALSLELFGDGAGFAVALIVSGAIVLTVVGLQLRRAGRTNPN